jgi:hypothetical protein
MSEFPGPWYPSGERGHGTQNKRMPLVTHEHTTPHPVEVCVCGGATQHGKKATHTHAHAHTRTCVMWCVCVCALRMYDGNVPREREPPTENPSLPSPSAGRGPKTFLLLALLCAANTHTCKKTGAARRESPYHTNTDVWRRRRGEQVSVPSERGVLVWQGGYTIPRVCVYAWWLLVGKKVVVCGVEYSRKRERERASCLPPLIGAELAPPHAFRVSCTDQQPRHTGVLFLSMPLPPVAHTHSCLFVTSTPRVFC